MTEFLPFPDIEASVGKALRDAGVCSGRVYSSIPANPTFPICLVRRVAGLPAERHKLDCARLQIDVWGNTKSDARAASEAARVAAYGLEGTTDSTFHAHITAVLPELGLTYLPDPETGRDRYTQSVAVYAFYSA